jgi:signal peptidase II
LTTTPAIGSRRAGSRRAKIWLLIAVAILVLAADQITKSLVVAKLSHHSVHLIGPLDLVLSYNTGVAFSLGAGFTLPIVIIVVCLLGAVIWFARGVVSWTGAVAFGLILGGAVGNLADRVFRGHHGAVVDFFYSGFWPTFNVADSCVVIGSALAAISYWRSAVKAPSPAKPATEER